MMSHNDAAPKIIRTSVMLDEELDASLRRLADAGNRPLSREIRAALEAWVANPQQEAA